MKTILTMSALLLTFVPVYDVTVVTASGSTYTVVKAAEFEDVTILTAGGGGGQCKFLTSEQHAWNAARVIDDAYGQPGQLVSVVGLGGSEFGAEWQPGIGVMLVSAWQAGVTRSQCITRLSDFHDEPHDMLLHIEGAAAAS